MEGIQVGLDEWNVLGDSGKTYKVTSTSCTCPRFSIYSYKKGPCKHMTWLKIHTAKAPIDTNKMFEYIKLQGTVYHEDLEGIFENVEEQVQILLNEGKIWASKPGKYETL